MKVLSCYHIDVQNDESDRGMWPTHIVQLCNAGSLHKHHHVQRLFTQTCRNEDNMEVNLQQRDYFISEFPAIDTIVTIVSCVNVVYPIRKFKVLYQPVFQNQMSACSSCYSKLVS